MGSGDQILPFMLNQKIKIMNRCYEASDLTPAEYREFAVGDGINIFRNQKVRTGVVRAFIGTEALVEYRMPNGMCFLNVVNLKRADMNAKDSWGRPKSWTYDEYVTFPYTKIPKKWRNALMSHTLWGFYHPSRRTGTDIINGSRVPVYSDCRAHLRDEETSILINWGVEFSDDLSDEIN